MLIYHPAIGIGGEFVPTTYNIRKAWSMFMPYGFVDFLYFIKGTRFSKKSCQKVCDKINIANKRAKEYLYKVLAQRNSNILPINPEYKETYY